MTKIELAVELAKIIAPQKIKEDSSIPKAAEDVAECLKECLAQIELNKDLYSLCED